MHPRKFVRDSIGFATSQYLVRILGTIRGLVAARLLGPVGYGEWNALMLLLDYGGTAPFGTYQGLDQSVPARIVDGDARALDRLKRAGLFNVLISTALFATVCLIYFGRSVGQIREAWGLSGIATALGVVLLTNVSLYSLTLMRSHGNIAAVSMWFLLQSVIGVVLGIALLPSQGAWGLLWGWLAGTVIAMALAMWHGRRVVPLVPRPGAESVALLAVGFPMFLSMLSNFVMRSLDRVIILRYLGTEPLGLYALAVTAVTFLQTLPDAVAYVLYPQLVRRYRLGGDDPAAIRDAVERSVRVVAIATPAFCAIAYLGADDVVGWVLPRFAPGVPALRILCFGAAAMALASLSTIVLMTLGRHRQLIPVAIGLCAIGVALDLLAIRLGLGIRGVAWATFITFALNSATLMMLAEAGMQRSGGQRIGFIVRGFLPLLIAIPLAWGFERLMPGHGPHGPTRLLRFVASAAGWIVLYGLLVLPLARGIGLRQLVSEFNWPWSPRREESADA